MAPAARRALQLERLRAALGVGGRARALLPRRARRRRSDARRVCAASTTSPRSDSPARRTCASTIPGACSRCRGRSSRGCTPRPAPRASPRWWATPGAISRCGARSWRARSPPRGAEPGHLIQIAYGYGLFTGGLGFHDGAEHMGLTVVPVSSGNTMRQILLLQDFRPQALACTPSFALHIGETMRESGQDPRALGVRFGFFGAEPWTEAMRAQLEALWGCAALDFYGLSELIGPGVAVECLEGREGLHVNEDHFLPEVVDPATGASLGSRQGRRAGAHRAHQGSVAHAPLPDGRPHPPRSRALPLRAHDGAHGAGQGAERRHAGDPWRQRLSLPGGGRAAHHGRAGPALSARRRPYPGLPEPGRARGARGGHRAGLGRLRRGARPEIGGARATG